MMDFQDMLQLVARTKNEGKTILVHSVNWPEVMWVAFKKDESGNNVCPVFASKGNGKFAPATGAYFKSFEIEDILAGWETANL